jgi:hypothetical protein
MSVLACREFLRNLADLADGARTVFEARGVISTWTKVDPLTSLRGGENLIRLAENYEGEHLVTATSQQSRAPSAPIAADGWRLPLRTCKCAFAKEHARPGPAKFDSPCRNAIVARALMARRGAPVMDDKRSSRIVKSALRS